MITAAFGDKRKDPTGWRQLAAHWGVGPVTVSSGKKKLVKRRRACDTHILQALTDFAFTTAFSVSGCWAFTFYQRKRSEGRDHHEALRAVALRWVKILWAMWNAGTAYSETYHRRRKQRAGCKKAHRRGTGKVTRFATQSPTQEEWDKGKNRPGRLTYRVLRCRCRTRTRTRTQFAPGKRSSSPLGLPESVSKSESLAGSADSPLDFACDFGDHGQAPWCQERRAGV